MKHFLFILSLCVSLLGHSKEWKSLKAYKKATTLQELSASDWLKHDRKKNTLVWQKANDYNLNANLPNEYNTISQRRDFYKWLNSTLKTKGHEVIWPAMAYFISNKLRLVNTFPYCIFVKRKIKNHSKKGSETVFNNMFKSAALIFNSEDILKGKSALEWDKDILYNEQYIWIDAIYKSIDRKSLKTIERIAKGKFLYGLVLSKSIRFEGDITIAKARYNYALNTLRPYNCLLD